MLIIDFKKFVENWRLATINPKKKELQVFIEDRINSIKKIQGSKDFNSANNSKAIKEQKFINAIIDLDSEYDSFLKYVDRKLNKALSHYEDYIVNGAKLREQNNFLKERLATMDERELMYLELLKNKR